MLGSIFGEKKTHWTSEVAASQCTRSSKPSAHKGHSCTNMTSDRADTHWQSQLLPQCCKSKANMSSNLTQSRDCQFVFARMDKTLTKERPVLTHGLCCTALSGIRRESVKLILQQTIVSRGVVCQRFPAPSSGGWTNSSAFRRLFLGTLARSVKKTHCPLVSIQWWTSATA